MKKSTNKTRYLILGLLCEHPLSGYEIKKIVDLRFSYFWNESYGQIYPELKRLESSELARPCSAAGHTRRDSKKYMITEKGMQELRSWLEAPVEKEIIRYELLLKMYFSANISSDVMLRHVREFQINHQKQQMLFSKFEEQLLADAEKHDNHEKVLMVLSFGQKIYRAYDEWCREAISVLEHEKRGGNKHVESD